MDEFWTGVAYLTQAGTPNEFGLIVPGVVLEHFLDLRLDEAERRAGLAGGTARTIEGPLYIAGAPLSKGEARLDDGTDDGEVLFMEGQVRDVAGKPIAGADVDVWHANTMGNYSHFDPTASRLTICVAASRPTRTAATGSGRSCRRGYACPPGSQTEKLLRRWAATASGRRTSTSSSPRPAIASSPRRSILTATSTCTTISPSAPATSLIPRGASASPIASEIHKAGLNKPFARIRFDFAVTKEVAGAPTTIVAREHAEAA